MPHPVCCVEVQILSREEWALLVLFRALPYEKGSGVGEWLGHLLGPPGGHSESALLFLAGCGGGDHEGTEG